MITIQKGKLSTPHRTQWEDWKSPSRFFKGSLDDIFEVRPSGDNFTLIIPTGSRMLSSDLLKITADQIKIWLNTDDILYNNDDWRLDYRIVDLKRFAVIKAEDFGNYPHNSNGALIINSDGLSVVMTSDPSTLLAKNVALTLPLQYDVAYGRQNLIMLVGAYYKYSDPTPPVNYNHLKSGRVPRLADLTDTVYISECIDGLIPYKGVKKIVIDASYKDLIAGAHISSNGELIIVPHKGSESWLLTVFPKAEFLLG